MKYDMWLLIPNSNIFILSFRAFTFNSYIRKFASFAVCYSIPTRTNNFRPRFNFLTLKVQNTYKHLCIRKYLWLTNFLKPKDTPVYGALNFKLGMLLQLFAILCLCITLKYNLYKYLQLFFIFLSILERTQRIYFIFLISFSTRGYFCCLQTVYVCWILRIRS